MMFIYIFTRIGIKNTKPSHGLYEFAPSFCSGDYGFNYLQKRSFMLTSTNSLWIMIYQYLWTTMNCQESAKEIKKQFEMQFLNETRTCTFRQDTPSVQIGGRKLGPFKSGSRVELPNWAVEAFDVHGLIDIDVTDAYESLRRLQNLYNAEEKQPHKLQAFPPLLYSALIRKMTRLESDKTSIDPRLHDDTEKFRKMLRIMIETRLSKIIRVAKSGAGQDKRKQMALEERWLCDELGNLLSAWREMVTE